MTTITLEVPDELIPQLNKFSDELPQLLGLALSMREAGEKHSEHLTTSIAINEVLDFLLSSPTPQEIAKFKVSPSVQARLETLLEKNRNGTLTASEQTELTSYQQINHLFILLKARSIKQ